MKILLNYLISVILFFNFTSLIHSTDSKHDSSKSKARSAKKIDYSAKYKNLDPKIAKFLIDLAEQDTPPINTLPVVDARKILDDLQKDSYNTIPAKVQEIDIPYEKDKTVSVSIVRPQHATGKLPVAIYFHGGGWILGDKLTHDRLIREIANKANIAIVFLNYTPSPEAQHATILEQAYATLQYVATHGADLNLDTNHLAVVGDSVGGNMAAVITLLAKKRKGPKIDYQVLFYPVTNANFNTKSYHEFANDFWLTKDAMKWYWDAYAPDVKERSKYTLSPLNATLEQLQDLPPALIINGENDILRDEGEAYGLKLMQAGVDVTRVRYLGTIHDFVMLDPLKDTAATRSAIDLASSKLKEVLHK